MNTFIESIDIWKVLIIYLLVLHIGSYMQLFFKKPLLRDMMDKDFSKIAYAVYWVVTTLAIIMTPIILAIAIWQFVV